MDAQELLKRYNEGERDFVGANLRGAGLQRADLGGANLFEANLEGANLVQRAFLAEANLNGADLQGAVYSHQTVWPEGFDPIAAGAVKVD